VPVRTNGSSIAVVGAAGHTGRFVVSDLRRRGWTPILVGRDPEKLSALAEAEPGSEVRVASIEAPASLDQALAGAAAVINCAGPFLDTAVPVIEASLRGRIHYLDVTAEQAVALDAFERSADADRAGIVVGPAMAFYGALADLLATVAMRDWASADTIRIGIALDSWKPTQGTRLTGRRNTTPRLAYANGALEVLPEPAPRRTWEFPRRRSWRSPSPRSCSSHATYRPAEAAAGADVAPRLADRGSVGAAGEDEEGRGGGEPTSTATRFATIPNARLGGRFLLERVDPPLHCFP
jgi:Saccharopine dehydrogenase NADP binding domain